MNGKKISKEKIIRTLTRIVTTDKEEWKHLNESTLSFSRSHLSLQDRLMKINRDRLLVPETATINEEKDFKKMITISEYLQKPKRNILNVIFSAFSCMSVSMAYYGATIGK